VAAAARIGPINKAIIASAERSSYNVAVAAVATAAVALAVERSYYLLACPTPRFDSARSPRSSLERFLFIHFWFPFTV